MDLIYTYARKGNRKLLKFFKNNRDHESYNDLRNICLEYGHLRLIYLASTYEKHRYYEILRYGGPTNKKMRVTDENTAFKSFIRRMFADPLSIKYIHLVLRDPECRLRDLRHIWQPILNQGLEHIHLINRLPISTDACLIILSFLTIPYTTQKIISIIKTKC